MAATVTLDSGEAGRDVTGDRAIRRGTITLGTYTTGGVAVTKTTFDLWVSLVDLRVDPMGGYVFEYVRTDSRSGVVKAYDQKDPAAAGGADIPFPQVANGTDLSAITSRFRAEGK